MTNNDYKLPKHPNHGRFEKERLIELVRLGQMKSPQNSFQAIVDNVKAQFNIPFCMISFIDECKLINQASHGFGFKEMQTDQAICAYAMHEDEMLVVPDATADEILQNHPFVKGPPYIRFYAGIPIRSNGLPVGTLCLADFVTRNLSNSDRQVLKQFGLEAEKVISTEDVKYSEVDYGNPVLRSQFLVYNKFLEESRNFFAESETSAINIKLKSEDANEGTITEEDMMVLAEMLDKHLAGIKFCKGTFGQANILLTVANSNFKSYGNAYLCRKALEAAFSRGCFKGLIARICYLMVNSFTPENLFQVNNVFSRVMTSIKFGDQGKIMIFSPDEVHFDFSIVAENNRGIQENGLQLESIYDISTGNQLIAKVKVPYEFQVADRGDIQLTETESDLLVEYNLSMIRRALDELNKCEMLVSVEICSVCVRSKKGRHEVIKQLQNQKDHIDRLVFSISGFGFGYHQGELYKFIREVRQWGVKIAFSFFSGMISHLPKYIIDEIDYGYSYTLLALNLKKYRDDETRVGFLVSEYQKLGITLVFMHCSQHDAAKLAAMGVNLFEFPLLPS